MSGRREWLRRKGFYDEEGLVMRKGRVVVPPLAKDLMNKIIQSVHASESYIHPGVPSTYDLCKKNFYWRKMKDSIQDWLSSCDACQRYKQLHQAQGRMIPLGVPDGKAGYHHGFHGVTTNFRRLG